MSLKRINKAIISGNTSAAKDAIERLGGKWNPNRKVWEINIANHPRNTMRERGNLQSDIAALAKLGCKISYE